MAAPRTGQGAYIGIGAHDSYTWDFSNPAPSAAIVLWFRAAGDTDNMQGETTVMEFPSLHTYQQELESKTDGRQMVTGSITFRLTYEYLPDLLRFITGNNITAAAAGGLYDYTFSSPKGPGDSDHFFYGLDYNGGSEPTGTSPKKEGLVIEVNKGDSTNSTYYSGCLPTETVFRFEGNSFVEVTMSFAGRYWNALAKSTPVYGTTYVKTPTSSGVAFLQLDRAGAGLKDVFCRSATLTIANPFEGRFDLGDKRAGQQPIPEEKQTVTLEVEIEPSEDGTQITDAEWAGIVQAPLSTSTVGFTQAVLTVQSAAATFNRLTFTLNHLVMAPGGEIRTPSIGPAIVNATFVAHEKTSATSALAWAAACRVAASDFEITT